MKVISKKNIFIFLPFAVFLFAALSFCLSHTSYAVSASSFNAGEIIDDSVFTHSGSMTVNQIQSFLNSKVTNCDPNGTQPSEMNNYQVPDYNGDGVIERWEWGKYHYNQTTFTCLENYTENGLSAAQIIYNVAQQYQINPQVLIVLLQKEEALITDTWPLSTQYRTATGYGCPDTSACDTTYYGFTNQVTWAAKMYHAIVTNDPNWYTPYILGNNTIQYNPTASCGSSVVNIVNRSTQALYNYTPYQPNQAAINAGYGNGDSCSSHGNLNFFLYFSDWFGSTLNNVSLEQGTSSSTVYVVYGNQKQGIPSPDVLAAWGLDKLPIYQVSDTVINAIPDSGVLTRLVKNPNNPSMLLLADSGNIFNAWPNAISNYGINTTTASTITAQLLTVINGSSNLSPFIQTPSVGGVLLVDNGSYHSFSSGDTLAAWGGQNPPISTLSNALFSTLTKSTNYGIFSGQAIDPSGNRFIAYNGYLQPLTGSAATNFPQVNQLPVSSALLNLLPQSIPITPYVKSTSDGTIYLVDGGQKHGFTNPTQFSNFISSSNVGSVTTLSAMDINNIPSGNPISSDFIYSSATPANGYYVSNTLTPLNSSFNASAYGLGVTSSTLGDFKSTASPLGCGSINGFIKSTSSPAIYMLEDGTKRPISNIRDFMLLDKNGSVCVMSQSDVDAIPNGTVVTPFVQYGGNNYIIDNGTHYLIDSSTLLSDFGVSSPSNINASTYNALVDGGTFTQSFVIGGQYYLTVNGKYYSTSNATIAQLWNVSNQVHTNWLLSGMVNAGQLSQYARSSDTSNSTIYLVDNGSLIGITNINAFMNSGGAGKGIASIDSSYIPLHTGAIWQGYLAKDQSGTIWVLDGGTKRKVNSTNQSDWVGTQTPTSLSNPYLSLLPQGSDLTLSVNTNGSSTIYGMDTGQKRGIPSLSMYSGTKYDPSSLISNWLFNEIPTGSVM